MIGVFGGSGFTDFLDDVSEQRLDTPFGPRRGPSSWAGSATTTSRSSPATVLATSSRPTGSTSANVWALKELGVTRIFGPCACGSLRADIAPTHFVVCDQLVDRTHGRADTYFDGPVVNHVSFADPYCPELRGVALAACEAEDVTVHADGTIVVVQGPRFSTRAESRSQRAAGWDVIGMTQYPESFLARELGLCYATIASSPTTTPGWRTTRRSAR